MRNYKTRSQYFNSTSYSPDCTSSKSSNHSYDGSSIVGNYFTRYSERGTPFDSGLDDTLYEEDIMVNLGDEASGYFSEESDDDSDETRKDDVRKEDVRKEDALKNDVQKNSLEQNNEDISQKKDKKDRHNSKAPILTNTTLSVLRQIGKYLQMSRLLRPIAFDIIVCMTQFFEFYLFSVHSFFTSDLVRFFFLNCFFFLIIFYLLFFFSILFFY